MTAVTTTRTHHHQPSFLADQVPASAGRASPTAETRYARIPLSRIDPDPRNPRLPTAGEVEELASSIQASGLLQPLVVRPVGDRYTVVAGHRRLAAWRRCAADRPEDPRWRVVECLVRAVDSEEALALMLVENLQRRALSSLQEAVALEQLRRVRGWTNRQVAAAVHKSEMYVSRRLRVLGDTALASAVLAGQLSVTTAEELLAADASGRAQLVRQAVAEGWTPDQARQAVRIGRHTGRLAGRNQKPAGDWRSQVDALQRIDPATLPTAGRQALVAAARALIDRCEGADA